MADDAKTEQLIIEFEHIIFRQLRTFGVVLHDDAGNMIKPGGPEEIRVLRNIARNCVQLVVLKDECQTVVRGSNEYAMMTPEEQWAYDKARGQLDDES